MFVEMDVSNILQFYLIDFAIDFEYIFHFDLIILIALKLIDNFDHVPFISELDLFFPGVINFFYSIEHDLFLLIDRFGKYFTNFIFKHFSQFILKLSQFPRIILILLNNIIIKILNSPNKIIINILTILFPNSHLRRTNIIFTTNTQQQHQLHMRSLLLQLQQLESLQGQN